MIRKSLLCLVFVEAFACFYAKIARVYVVSQQRARSVFGISKVSVEHLHNEEAGVEADKVSERKWAHWDVGAQFHSLVNVLFRSNAFIQSINSLVDVWHEQSVGNEARSVLRCRSFLSHLCSQPKYIAIYSSVVLCVSSEVCRALMTSTSFMTGTGFMKCMPMT